MNPADIHRNSTRKEKAGGKEFTYDDVKCKVQIRKFSYEGNQELIKELIMELDDTIFTDDDGSMEEKREMRGRKAEVFLSYCWADEKIADEVYDNLIRCAQINLHRDKLNIGQWGSIKEYMQSIAQMDYTILLISEAYLKSSNCMYEVLEVMRDRKYKDKIFPAIIYSGIYDPLIRANFVKYWQDELSKLKDVTNGIDAQNLGPLTEDLKHRQDIASNIAEFLGMVSDMNNPQIDDISDAIEKKLLEKGIIDDKRTDSDGFNVKGYDLFTMLGINNCQEKAVVTDLDINQFMVGSYRQIRQTFEELCKQFEEKNNGYKVITEAIDTRNCIFQFYRNGSLVTGLKLSLDDSFGSLNIGISNNSYSFASGHSWNGLYSATILDGELKLKSLLSIGRAVNEMGTNDVVKDIWEYYVKPYLDR